MLKKYRAAAILFGSVFFLGLLIIHRTTKSDLPRLNFEHICPDSAGQQPLFTLNNINSDYLKKLRTKFDLDKHVAHCNSEIEKIVTITNLVNNLWQHNGDNIPVKSDPLSILDEVIKQKKQFRCVEYSIVIAGCLNALGIPCRILRLRTKDCETRAYGAGHVVNEAYITELEKWIMIDGQQNVIPIVNAIPLNAIEFQKALATQQPGLDIISAQQTQFFKEYADWIGNYLYYFVTELAPNQNYKPDRPSIMLVPLKAKKPTIFQKKWPITNMLYTHSVTCFYQKPHLPKTVAT